MRSLVPLALVFAVSSSAAGVLDDLADVETLPYPERAAAVDRLLERHPENPVLLDMDSPSPRAVLLYRGPGREIRAAGDRTGWERGPRWRHVAGTDLWFQAIPIAREARLDYKLLRDGAYILDPRNSAVCMSGFGPNSELRGPAYREPDWLSVSPEAPCRLDTLRVTSHQLGDTRTVVVVVPPGEARGPRPFLLVHDGLEYLEIAGLHRYLAVAAERGAEDLPICVCVPPVRRTEEYATDVRSEFTRFVVDTVMPLIEERYADEGAVGRPWGSMGASFGGRITLELAHRFPGRFDRLAPMSPSVAREQHAGVEALDPTSLRLYVNWGEHDIPRLIPGCEAFALMLEEKGFDHAVEVLPQGHSWGLWRDTLDAAFTTLYGR